jgi:hypothetical protein
VDIFDELHHLESEPLLLRGYPPVIYLYPSLILGALCGLLSVLGTRTYENPGILGTVFVVGVFFNLTVLTFKYTKRTSTNMGWVLLSMGALAAIFEGFGEFISKAFTQSLFMNGSFYGLWTVLLLILVSLAIGLARMDTWTIQGTELVRSHGFGSSERYPILGLRVETQTDDLAAYALLRAGHISIFGGPGLPIAHFTNVPNVKAVEAKLQQHLTQAQNALPGAPCKFAAIQGDEGAGRTTLPTEQTTSYSVPLP